jgi:hypothetical protein
MTLRLPADLPFLDETFPLPLDRPFTSAEARDQGGLTYADLRRLVDQGFLVRPIRNVYVAAQVPDSTALRCACLRLVVPEDAVVCDRHAGWLHGAEMVLAPNEHIDLAPISVFLPPGRRLRNDLADSGERSLLTQDVTELDGLRVTTPIRTAWDLGRQRWLERSLAALDQMLRLEAFSKEELVDGLPRFRGMRWVTRLNAMAPLADGRAESPPESVLRLYWIQVNLPTPEPQLVVLTIDGDFVARLDLGNEPTRYAAEYDGAEWHSTPEQLAHDRRRRADADGEGWTVTPFRKDDVFGPSAQPNRLLLEGIAEARRRHRRPS